MSKILRYDNKEFATLTDSEAEDIKSQRGMHLNFKGNLLKMAKVEIMSGEEVEDVKIWQKTTEELKEIIGDFEKQLISHKDGIPKTAEGKHRAVLDGKLPDVGAYWLEDRGILLYYLETGWIFTENPKDGEKRRWALTQKYNLDKIWKIEEALEELQHRRIYAEEEEIKNGDPLISEIYEKEKVEKIARLRSGLALKFGWGQKV